MPVYQLCKSITILSSILYCGCKYNFNTIVENSYSVTIQDGERRFLCQNLWMWCSVSELIITNENIL